MQITSTVGTVLISSNVSRISFSVTLRFQGLHNFTPNILSCSYEANKQLFQVQLKKCNFMESIKLVNVTVTGFSATRQMTHVLQSTQTISYTFHVLYLSDPNYAMNLIDICHKRESRLN